MPGVLPNNGSQPRYRALSAAILAEEQRFYLFYWLAFVRSLTIDDVDPFETPERRLRATCRKPGPLLVMLMRQG
jgi:hypothetical protein